MTKGNENIDPRFVERLEAVSAGGQLAIVLCADAFRHGGNWGFIRRNKPNFREQLETLREERPNVEAIPVANGALILVKEDFLAYNVNKIIPNAIGKPFVERVKQRRLEEQERFVKFINSVIQGKSSYVKSKGGYYELVLGVYSINDTNLIRLNGVDYPAYKLTAIEALDYADKALASVGRKAYVLAVKENGERVFDRPMNLANSKGIPAIYRGLEIADSDTGLFLTLRIV